MILAVCQAIGLIFLVVFLIIFIWFLIFGDEDD